MANLLVKGAAFPGSPSTGDPFFRDDLGFWCYYDGTRWLSTAEFSVNRSPISASSLTNANLGVARDDYALYFTRVSLVTSVDTTNDGSNYWSCDIRSYDITTGNHTVIYSVNTSSDSPDTWVDQSAAPSTPAPTYYGQLSAYLDKTSSPGAISVRASAYFRLIVT